MSTVVKSGITKEEYELVFLVPIPKWLKEIKDTNVASSVFAIVSDCQLSSKSEHIGNLRQYIEDVFIDLTNDQVEEVTNLLIRHGMVKKSF